MTIQKIKKNLWKFYMFVVVLFCGLLYGLSPQSFGIHIGGSFRGFLLIISTSIIIFLLAIALQYKSQSDYKKIRFEKKYFFAFFFFIFLYIFACSLSFLNAKDFELFRQDFFTVILGTFTLIISYNLIYCKKQLDHIICVIMFATIIPAILGLFQLFYPFYFIETISKAMNSDSYELLLRWFMEGKVAANYVETSAYGYFIVIGIPIFIYKLNATKIKRMKIVFLLSLIILTTGVIICGQRGPFIVMISMLLSYYVLSNISKEKRTLLQRPIIMISLILSLICFFIAFQHFFRLNQNITDIPLIKRFQDNPLATGDSTTHRLAIYKEGIRLFAENPMIGVGLGNFIKNNTIAARGIGFSIHGAAQRPHSIIIQLISETGILGIFSYLIIFLNIFCIFNWCINKEVNEEQKNKMKVLIIAVMGTILGGLVDNSLQIWSINMIIWLIVGAFLGIRFKGLIFDHTIITKFRNYRYKQIYP